MEYKLREDRIQFWRLSGFRRLRAAASSSDLKVSEILLPSGVEIFHRSDSCLLTRLVDAWSCVLRFSLVRRFGGVFRDGAQARGASRPASEFVDGAPRLAARVREVDVVDSLLPLLLLLLFELRK